ncbi:Putative transposase InsK for insertion sequence element IS150 [Streptomyces hirsutus]
MTAEFRDEGERVNHKRVARVMRKFNIVGLHLRKKVRTTIPEPAATPVPDLLRRDFTAIAPNTRYVGDITYLPIGDGQFLYLATVLDLCSKRLAGWSIADHMRTSLVTDALKAAAAVRGAGGLHGAIFHSDNGAQYASKELAQVCEDLGVIRSRGAVGTSADNRRRGIAERIPETGDAAGEEAVDRGARGPARGLPLGDPLQHPKKAFPPRSDQPNRLRATINYAGHCRMTTGVHDQGSRPSTNAPAPTSNAAPRKD